MSTDIKFLQKNNRFAQGSSSAPIVPPPTPNTIDGLLATDVSISANNLALEISKNGEVVAYLPLQQINGWEINGNSVSIYSDDTTVVIATFANGTELATAIAMLKTAMNS